MLRAGAVILLILMPACDVFRGGSRRPKTNLTQREFVDVYVELSKARTPEAKSGILKQHGVTQKELEHFVAAYADNLTAFSEVFDSVVARQGLQTEVPALPR